MNKCVRQIQSNYSYVFHCVRWASFREFVYHVNERITAILGGVKDVNFIQHIGGAYYISVASDCHCVHLTKYFQPYYCKDTGVKPIMTGLSLRFDEWWHLCTLIDIIDAYHGTLIWTRPCYYEEDHMDPLNALNCKECYPFLDNFDQPLQILPSIDR